MNDLTNVPVTKTRPASSLRDLATQISEPVGWLRSEIDRLFDDFGSSGRSLFHFAPRGALAIVPALELVDDEKAYRLTAELPGLDEKDVEINVADGVLSISGEKKEEEERKEKGFLLSERRYGSFRRQISLPADVDAEGIKAQFKDGVLTVTLAKDENAAARTRKIAIEKA
ncbi:Hsp20/alpha crystallin family protein [Sphingobium sp. CFD-1]|uniref:Hsp20/alpha crystallin family protein n=1 Tax=Sphingobium sp. CFD-1 TaxID=2878545 RepID=UPI00214AFB48|nr:Hsp20/alpha crystallin family protein [Sphingobium sp. CFD-1]